MVAGTGTGVTPRLGLVCITVSDRVRYRTITRKQLLQLPAEQQALTLRRLYADNAARLERAVEFCLQRGLRLYRITSNLFPSSDEPPGSAEAEALADTLGRIGAKARAGGLRLVFHPDQFVVLNSDDPQVVATSVGILDRFGLWLDWLGQPRSPWAAIEIHGGKGGRAERLIETIRTLPEPVRSRLVLENDERAYGAAEILAVCRAAGVPMVFDAHHHVVHDGLDSYEHPSVAELLAAARATWPDPAWQMVHISNGKESFGDRRHSDLITVMPSSFRHAPWIEVEAKLKEQAIDKLQRDWLTTA